MGAPQGRVDDSASLLLRTDNTLIFFYLPRVAIAEHRSWHYCDDSAGHCPDWYWWRCVSVPCSNSDEETGPGRECLRQD